MPFSSHPDWHERRTLRFGPAFGPEQADRDIKKMETQDTPEAADAQSREKKEDPETMDSLMKKREEKVAALDRKLEATRSRAESTPSEAKTLTERNAKNQALETDLNAGKDATLVGLAMPDSHAPEAYPDPQQGKVLTAKVEADVAVEGANKADDAKKTEQPKGPETLTA